MLFCMLLAVLTVLAAEAALFFAAATATIHAVPGQIDAARIETLALVDRHAQALRVDAFQEIDAQALLLQRQIAATRMEAMAEIDAIRAGAIQTAAALVTEADLARQDAREQLTATNYILARGVGAAMETADHANSLIDAYGALPATVAKSPAWLAIKPEITCRHADGSGYGGCWHSRVTAVLGETANAGGVFVKQFPAFSDSVTGIAEDVHKFTSKAVAPRGFWGTFKDFLSTGSGVTRALGAAGVF
jgi:hypothetical protein